MGFLMRWYRLTLDLPDKAAWFVMGSCQPVISRYDRRPLAKTCLITMSHLVYAFSDEVNLVVTGSYSYR
jgi:hypothetical protein